MMSLLHIGAHCLFCLKKMISIVLTAHTFSSFIEAVNELYLHTLAYKCMENDFYTIAITDTWHLLPFATKKKISLN